MTSSPSMPETGQQSTLRAESPQAWTVVIPPASSRRQISGTAPILIPVQLDVLPRRQIEIAIAPERMRLRTAGVLVGDLADQPGLRRGQPPAGDLDPQHEGVAPCRCG